MLDPKCLNGVNNCLQGQRIAILKAVYMLKQRNDVPIEEGHWVPPCTF